MFERFDFTDDGQYFRVVVLKIGRVRVASYSNRVGFSVWRVRASQKKSGKKVVQGIAPRQEPSYTF
jgi:hypothetical protein